MRQTQTGPRRQRTPNANLSPVNIVRHLERSPDQIHVRGRFQQHLYDIKSIGNPGIIQHSEPFFCASHDSLLLGSCHPRMGWSKCVGGACFHFNENQCLCPSIAANQIDFATPFRSEISVEDPKPIPAEILSRHFFAGSPDRQMARNKLSANYSWPKSTEKEKTSEQPARMSADESRKVRESVGSQGAPAFHSLCFGRSRIAGTRYAISSSYGLA